MAELDQLLFATPAQVTARATATELLELARSKAAIDPSIFEDRPPFFWQAEISNNRVDAYFTRMAPSTLQNFAADATAGVSFQNSHATNKLGFGRSLLGQFVGPGGNGVSRCLADFYTIPGLRLHDVSTDDFILGVRAGIVSDVSVGFYGGEFRCNICGRDMMRDWDCTHIPGFEYEVATTPQRADSPVQTVMAIAWIENAHLGEVSAVYDGACPGAAILKAQSEAENGRINPTHARLIEARYRIRLPEPRTTVRGATINTLVVTTPAVEITAPAPLGRAAEPAPTTPEAAPVAADEAHERAAAEAGAPTPQEIIDMPNPEAPAVAEAPAQERAADEAVYYQCPKCDYRSDEPGDCMNCEVALVRTERAAPVAERAADVETPAAEPATEDVAAPEAEPVAAEVPAVEERAPEADTLAEVRGMLALAGVANPNDVPTSVRALVAEVQQLRPLDDAVRTTREAASSLEVRASDMERTITQVREALSGVEAPEGASLLERVQHLLSARVAAEAEVSRLTPLADEGREYRSDLVNEALAEGVRAYGPDFAEDTYRAVLENASLDTVKRMRADWRKLADRQFVPGRVTVDTPLPATTPEAAPAAPAAQPARAAAPNADIPSAAFKD
jgi:outer membrane murein-binding lipoprotein Lpp